MCASPPLLAQLRVEGCEAAPLLPRSPAAGPTPRSCLSHGPQHTHVPLAPTPLRCAACAAALPSCPQLRSAHTNGCKLRGAPLRKGTMEARTHSVQQ